MPQSRGEVCCNSAVLTTLMWNSHTIGTAKCGEPSVETSRTPILGHLTFFFRSLTRMEIDVDDCRSGNPWWAEWAPGCRTNSIITGSIGIRVGTAATCKNPVSPTPALHNKSLLLCFELLLALQVVCQVTLHRPWGDTKNTALFQLSYHGDM